MIGECEDHGYYRCEDRGRICPLCGEEGKFMMSDFEIEKVGRILAGMLRHGKNGAQIDRSGFVPVRDVLDAIKARNPRMGWIRPRHIEALVVTDPKGRYVMSGDKVRATYGHTIDLDLPLDYDDVPADLFYPISDEEADNLLENGIDPTDRAMVHLSYTYADAKRAGSVRYDDPIILLIDVDECEDAGYRIGRAAKTVFLCSHVPPEALYVAEPEEFEVSDEEEGEDY